MLSKFLSISMSSRCMSHGVTDSCKINQVDLEENFSITKGSEYMFYNSALIALI